MGLKTGLLIGFGAGYVLGSRAGKERYEQIKQWWEQVSSSPGVQRAMEQTKGVAGDTAKRGLSVVQSSIERAGDSVRDRLHRGESDAAEPGS
jgi:hypothetical protein